MDGIKCFYYRFLLAYASLIKSDLIRTNCESALLVQEVSRQVKSYRANLFNC